ncbi:MAG: copper transporter, partial [Agromyces sp.]
MRAIRVFGPAVVLLTGTLAALLGLAIGGGAAALPLEDPGPFVRFALPLATLTVNVAAAGMIGALLLAIWAIPAASAGYGRALDVAAGSAAITAVA